ncbi:MAG: ATP-binding protein, partial [Methanomicrobiales archaeon]
SKGSIFGREIHLKRKNNEIFWGRISAIAVRNQQGDVQYFDGFIEDITDKKRAEEALQLANKKLTLLSSITRHDITNKLTVLQGYLAILKKKQSDPTLNDYFVKVSTAAQNISSMIQFTREYECVGVKAPAWQDCRTLVDSAAKEAPLGKIVVKNDLPAGAEVFADPLIVKVFYNLMDNAVRYGGKITTIRFSVEEAGDDHLIICEDDGDGVIAEEKEKIFERGFGKNTGLGLALSREILSITGITLRETGEPGKGARFEMTVPKGAWRIAGKAD